MILCSIILLFAFVVCISSLVKFPNLPSRFLAGHLIGFSNIVFVLLLTSLFHRMNDKIIVLCFQAVLLSIAVLVWLCRGKPPLFIGIKQLILEIKLLAKKDSVRKNPIVSLLGLCVVAFYLFDLVLIWVVAPNSSDAMHTHLSRVGYWLQNGSLLPWVTTNAKQIFYPVNISLQTYWTVLFWGTDRLVGYIQWIGAVVTILVVFGIARLLKASRSQAIFAATVWSSFSIVFLQSTTAQTDLATAALFMSGVYFLILGMQTKSNNSFIFSGLGIALALGSKQIILFYLPGLILFCLVNCKFFIKNPSRVAVWGMSAILSFLLLSSYIYISNFVTYGNFAGPNEEVASSIGDNADTLKYNIPRLVYQSVDFSGLPDEAANLGNRAKAKLMEGIFDLTGFTLEVPAGNAQDQSFKYRDFIPMTEDTGWFGFASLVILLPAVVIAFVHSIKKKNRVILGLLLSSMIFLPIESYLRWGWDPYQGRYFIAAVGLVAPMMFLLVKDTNFSKAYLIFSTIVVATAFCVITLFNPTKPLKSNGLEIFTADRAKLQSLSGGNALWRFSYMINRSLPNDAVVAYYAPDLIYDYVLFGEHFSRHIIPIADPEKLADDEWLKAQGIQFVLVDVRVPEPDGIDEKLVPYDEVKGSWMLYTWSKVK